MHLHLLSMKRNHFRLNVIHSQYRARLLRSDRLRLGRHDRLATLVRHETTKPVIVGVVDSIPIGDNFIFC